MSRAGTTRTFTISFPVKLADQVDRLAKKESRTKSELFREAFRTYRAEQLRASLDEINATARAKDHKGYRSEDVEALVDEVRTKIRNEKRR